MGLLDVLMGGGTPEQSDQIMALAQGLLSARGSQGLANGVGLMGQAKQNALKNQMAQLQMQAAQQGLQKGGLELSQMQQSIDRANKIRDELAKLQTGSAPAAPAAPQFNTPTVGDVPMFSQGTALATPAVPVSPAAAPDQPGNLTRALSQRLIQQAGVYANNGDFEGANKLYEHAAKFMPEVKEMGVLMQGGKPVNVITFKDGTQQVTPFDPTPKVHYLDNGQRIQPINEYTQQPIGASVQREQTPDSKASNAVAWANNALSGQRLALEKDQLEAGKIPAGYRRKANDPGALEFIPGGPADPDAAKRAALTESQGNATAFAARMADASKVVDALESKVRPSQVAQAGYKPEFPVWMPGGQILSAGITALNKEFTPEDAQKYRQAQENWVTANLRKESGAAISKDEMNKDIAKWFPQPGEPQSLIEQKTAARKVAERAMAVQAGPGAAHIQSIVDGTPAPSAARHSPSATPAPTMRWNPKTNKVEMVN